MSGINALLNDAYAKTAATAEDLEKTAQLEYFGALCERESIDVARLDDEQAMNLFKTAMEMKAAEEEAAKEEKKEEGKEGKKAPPFGGPAHEAKETPKEEKKEEKAKEAAVQEWQSKVAEARSAYEATVAGRLMADAFIDQMQKRAAAGEAGAAGDAARAVIEQAKIASAAPARSDTPSIDFVAGNRAIDLLKEAGYDADEVVSKVNAIYTLGLPASTKLASVPDFNSAVEMRALEICELAGASVDWSKV